MIMPSYERFINDGDVSDSTPTDNVNIRVDDGEGLADKQVQINKTTLMSSHLTLYDDDKDETKVYIEDPAGNPFAPKSTLQYGFFITIYVFFN